MIGDKRENLPEDLKWAAEHFFSDDKVSCTCDMDVGHFCEACLLHLLLTRAADEIEKLRIPLCIGWPTIQKLAETGKAEFADHAPLIAADGLYENVPFPSQKTAFLTGFIEGLKEYAWWKDGVQYVGTCGTTLQKAIDRAKADSGQQL